MNWEKLRVSWIKVKVLIGRDLANSLANPIFYLVLSGGLLAGLMYLNQQLNALVESGLLVLNEPMLMPMVIVILISGLYASFMSAFSLTQERETGTMKVLFFGPVNEGIYLASHLLGQGIIFSVGIFVSAMVLGLVTIFTGVSMTGLILGVVCLGILFGLCLEAVGLIVAVLAGKTRTAIMALLALFGVFFGLQFGAALLRGLPGTGSVINQAKDLLEMLSNLIKTGSPFSYFLKGVEGLQLGRFGMLCESIASSLLFIVILYYTATRMLRQKGVR